jgi:membrane protease YdiL (CAAX protease family)
VGAKIKKIAYLCFVYKVFVMKKAIILIFVYLLIQLLLGAVEGLALTICKMMHVDAGSIQSSLLSATLLLSMLIMWGYMYFVKELPTKKESWSFPSLPYLLLTLVLSASTIVINDWIGAQLAWLPDLMKDTFAGMSTGVLGILSITIIGPIFEETLFRGGITRNLLKQYSPTKAILLSAFIIHINPAQIVPAFFAGLILATLYYRTGSLIPGILLHIAVNSTSTFFSTHYTNVDSLKDVLSGSTYLVVLIDAIFFFLLSIFLMKRMTDRKKKELAADNSQQPICNDSQRPAADDK